MKTIHATYENGVLTLEERLDLPSGAKVELLLREPDDELVESLRARFPKSYGWLSREEGEAMMKAIDEEFGRIDPDAWK